MELELSEHWRQHLQKLPESAMGSQHVDIILNTGNVFEDVTVFNGRFAQFPRALRADESIVDIIIHEMKGDG
jgi:hypothetical protein